MYFIFHDFNKPTLGETGAPFCLSASSLHCTQGTEHLSKPGLCCKLAQDMEAQKEGRVKAKNGHLVFGISILALKIECFASRSCPGASDTYCKPSVLVRKTGFHVPKSEMLPRTESASNSSTHIWIQSQ